MSRLPLQRLHEVCAENADRVIYTWLDGDGAVAATLTGAQLEAGSADVAARLAARGLRPGDRALLAHPPGLDFVVALFGCLRAGVIAVPTPPPPPPGTAGFDAFARIAADCGAAVALTSSTWRLFAELAGLRMRLRGTRLSWMATDRPPTERGADVIVSADDVALLQYTSGSTGAPRGVRLTHGNLAHQLASVCEAGVGISARSTLVWWVPQFHDFGLVSGIFSVACIGAHGVVYSPLDFVWEPAGWMRAASRYRATHLAAPDFAYALATARTPVDGLDLSAVEVAMSAGEPVRHTTIDRFLDTFAPAGLSREAFCPAYGLAEHTVGVSVGGRTARFVDAAALGEGTVRPGDRCVVSAGSPCAGVEVRILDSEGGPARVGEIVVRSPSVAPGYWRGPVGEATGGPEGGWLRTGDEGFLDEGALYVTGRLKDLVIVRGRNVYPQDVEDTVARVPGVKPGRIVAFGDDTLIVAAELRKGAPDAGVAEAIARLVAEVHGVGVSTVLIVAPGGITKTTSGKVQRRQNKAMWRAGTLRVLRRWDARAEPAVERQRVTTLERLRRAVYEATLRWVPGDTQLVDLPEAARARVRGVLAGGEGVDLPVAGWRRKPAPTSLTLVELAAAMDAEEGDTCVDTSAHAPDVSNSAGAS